MKAGRPTFLTLLLPCLLLAGAPSRAAEYRWERTEKTLALYRGENSVWRFSAGSEAGKPYFHPVTLPDGTVATDYRPADHKWHLGVWFTFNKVNDINFWGEDEKGRIWGPGRINVETVVFTPREDFSATIALALAYCRGEERLLVERRQYDIGPPNARAHTITSHHEFTAVTNAVINRYDYGGTVFRPARDLTRWRWETAPPLPNQRPFDFPDRYPGKYNQWLMRPPAQWMALVERTEGETRGVLILDHPANPRYPTCWGGLAYNANVWLADDMPLAAGEKLTLRYRLVFFGGATLASFAEEQHALFVQETK